jgi:hypothetical protein
VFIGFLALARRQARDSKDTIIELAGEGTPTPNENNTIGSDGSGSTTAQPPTRPLSSASSEIPSSTDNNLGQ